VENDDADLHSLSELDEIIALDTNAIIINDRQTIIDDAVLVQTLDEEVIIATPLEPELPWLKQKRIQMTLSVVLLFVVPNAIAIVLLYSGNDGNNKPSTAPAPTPSGADSTSLNSHQPSLLTNYRSPKACADQVSANAQKVETGVDDPQHPRIAVDGSNMVLAVSDGKTTSSQVVIFYSLAPSTETWEEVQSFQMNNVVGVDASVALSGKTALVGFGEANNFAGVVLVFEQNQLGGWDRVNDLFILANADESRYGFGLHHVAIDGDLGHRCQRRYLHSQCECFPP
jgi:hypothetical protein